MVYSAKSNAAGVISQFTRRKAIKVTTAGTSTPAAYQVKVTIAYEPAMQTSFQDIRFNTKANVYIDYWIESFTASTTATVWIELPDAITDPGSDTIWMYYGNAAVSDGGSGTDTFDVFNGATLTGTNYQGASILNGMIRIAAGVGNYITLNTTVSRPHIIEYNIIAQVSGTASGGDGITAVNTYPFSDGATKQINFHESTNGNTYTCFGSPATTFLAYKVSDANNHKRKIVWTSTTASFYEDGVQKTSPATNFPDSTTMYVGFGGMAVAGSTVQQDIYNIRVRKYIAIEPTPSVGTAQHQRRVPRFL